MTNGVNLPYQNLQTILYEKRIDLLDDDDQTNELVALELHEDGTVDKPADGGTDDASQALCGSVLGCGSFKEEFLRSNAVLLENMSGTKEDLGVLENIPEDAVASLLSRQFSDYLSPNRIDLNSGLRQEFDSITNKPQQKTKKSGFNFF